VRVLPADPAAAGAPIAVDPVARPPDPAQLLHVDVDELARPLPLITVGGLRRLQPGEPTKPDPGQDRRDRRDRHPEPLGDLPAPQPLATERRDRLHTLVRGALRDPVRSRGAVEQTLLTLLSIAPPPLRDRAHADPGGLGRRAQRPTLPLDSPDHKRATMRTGPRVTVQLHPVTSLVLVALTPPASKEAGWNNAPGSYN